MSETPRECEDPEDQLTKCPQFRANWRQIDRGLKTAALNGCATRTEPWVYCPWCGGTLVADPLRLYRQLRQRLLRVRETGSMDEEEEILDRMDAAWAKLTAEQRTELDPARIQELPAVPEVEAPSEPPPKEVRDLLHEARSRREREGRVVRPPQIAGDLRLDSIFGPKLDPVPDPPEGKRWHRLDFKPEDLVGGFRPLLLGEHPEKGDEHEGPPHFQTGERWYQSYVTEYWSADQLTVKCRTKRPIE